LVIAAAVDYYCCCCRLLLLLLVVVIASAAEQGWLTTANELTTCCCEQIRHAAGQNSIHELPIADLFRWSWGRWRVLKACCNCYRKCWFSSKLIGY